MIRPFKAGKSTSGAEYALITVIIISFSWSAYALYKIVLGSSDSSLFGFSIVGKAAEVKPRIVTPPPKPSVNLSSQIPAELSVSEQLAAYKSQIISELLARQRELLANQQAQQQQQHLAVRPQRTGNHASSGTVNFDELSQWRGGYALPQSLASLLMPTQQRNELNLPQSSRRNARLNREQQQQGGNLILLGENAPSLGQLSAQANKVALREAEVRINEQARLNERQPEESNVDEKAQSAAQSNESQSEANSAESDEEAVATTTTTTSAPPTETTTASSQSSSESEPDSNGKTGDDEESDDGPSEQVGDNESGAGQAEESEQQQQDTKAVDDESLARARKAVNAIDEEVDRMTQPSVGSLSRHKEPSGGPLARRAGDLGATVYFDDNPHELRPARPAILPDGDKPKASLQPSRLHAHQHRARAQRRTESHDPMQVADLNLTNNTSATAKQSIDGTSDSDLFTRKDKIRAKQELQIDPNHDLTRRARGKRETLGDQPAINNQQLAMNKIASDHWPRRTSDRDYAQDEEEQEASSEEEKYLLSSDRIDRQAQPSYQQEASSDPSLRELIAHKQLLDALRQSRQVPAPIAGSNTPNGSELSSNQLQSSGATQGRVEHQPAAGNSIYSLDEGLLLTPAQDEEHEHISMGKKKMKKQEKKQKKKLTMAMKKGGHKKKKHKKEEKKYLKEKKFKGAKKGKKMSKGKGGKGGKKGSKYYKDKGFKKKGFKNIYVKNEFGQKKSYFDEFRDKNFKKKWKNFDDKYNYAQMKKWQAKDVKAAKKMKDQGEKYKKYDKGKWKKKFHKEHESESSKKKKKFDQFR